ncbi:MAG: hypothetical protein E6Q97_25920 [Desulfurellales bacterium]|nr:MAG: hypothetical protein E6Q97_25920 [Desulfurellales bacterium]
MPSYDDNSADSAVLNDELTSTPTALFADAAVTNDLLNSLTGTAVTETACLNDAVVQVIVYQIIESAILNDGVLVSSTFTDLVTDAGRLDDGLTLAMLANLVDSVESAQFNDRLTSLTDTSISESGSIGDAMTYALSAHNNLVEAGRLNDALASHLSNTISDTATLNDAVSQVVRAISLIVESAVLNDAVAPSASAMSLVIEVAVLSDAVQQTASTADNVVEDALLDDHVTGGGAGGAWLAHLETFAMARWTNQPWNSMAQIGGRLVAASDDGLYWLDATDDAGAAIEASLEYDWLNAKVGGDGKSIPSPQLKRPRFLYLEYKGGPLALYLGHVQNGSEAEAEYAMPARVANAFINGRTELGRGIRSVYLKPRLENVDGADFAVNSGRLSVDEQERSIA